MVPLPPEYCNTVSCERSIEHDAVFQLWRLFVYGPTLCSEQAFRYSLQAEANVPPILAPTALALTTSLLSTSLPVAECRRHLAVFSVSTPVGTLVSYTLLSFFGASSHNYLPGIALLFSVRLLRYIGLSFLTLARWSGWHISLRGDCIAAVASAYTLRWQRRA